MRGNPLFVVLRARRPCINVHRGISRALTFTMHVGPTPSGPAPPQAKTLIFSQLRGDVPTSCVRPPQLCAATKWKCSSIAGTRIGTGKGREGKGREGKGRKKCGGTRFLKEGAPLTAIMHQCASCYIEGSRSQDACWLHAEWTRTPSGRSRAERGIARHPWATRQSRRTACPTILRYPPILSVTGTKLLRTAIIASKPCYIR